MEAVRFIIGNNNTYYKLEPGKDLLGFAEFNFSFFWEQCIEAGKTAYKTGRLPTELMQTARNAVVQCHPYVKACIAGSFDSVAIDCIIAYICSSEHIGLEELWARCISPKNNYETAIFRRISEYKTGRSVNQWINIVRINEYAKKKLDFIYDDKAGSDIKLADYRRRKEYFDLAFSVAANEMGYPVEDMPCVKKYNPSLAPDAVFRLGKFSHYVYKAVSEELQKIPSEGIKKISRVTADQCAMDAFSYIKDISRPDPLGMRRAVLDNPDDGSVVYMPAGFKGIIDLEFDLLDENNKYIERCASCGRYFIRDEDYNKPYCSRVNPTGRTCRSVYEEQLRLKREAERKARLAEEEARRAEEEARRAAEEAEEKARLARKRTERIPVIIPSELELRCRALYYNLSKCAGKEMNRAEFEEWAEYMDNLKDNVRNGDGSISQLEDFVRSAEKMYGSILNGEKIYSAHTPSHHAEGHTYSAYIPKSKKVSAERAVKWIPKSFDSVSAAKRAFEETPVTAPTVTEKISPKQPEQAAVKEQITEDGRKYKPFIPKKYASLYEAMTDPKYIVDSDSPTVGDFMGITELAAEKKDTFVHTSLTDEDIKETMEEDKLKSSMPPTRVIRKSDRTVLRRK